MKLLDAIKLAGILSGAIVKARRDGDDHVDLTAAELASQTDGDARAELETAIERAKQN